MISKLKQKLLSPFSSKNTLSSGDHPMFLQYRDWKIMIITFALLIIIVTAAFSYMFTEIKEGTFFTEDSDGEQIEALRLQRGKVTDAVGYYEQKRNRFNDLEEESPQTVDPF